MAAADKLNLTLWMARFKYGVVLNPLVIIVMTKVYSSVSASKEVVQDVFIQSCSLKPEKVRVRVQQAIYS